MPRKSQRALAGRFSTQHSPRSSNSRTPFVLHSKLSTLLSGLAGHSFSCSLYCILTHPCELSGGSQFRQIISIFLNGYIAICLVIDLLQCLSLRQLRSCNILFPTLSAIWMCQLDKCPANNFPRGTSVTVSSPAVYGFSSFWSTVFGKRRSSTVLLAVQSICALLHNTGQYNVQLLTNSKVNRLIKINILRL